MNKFPQSHSFQITDERFITFYEFGDPSGIPLFYFHGFPGSGMEGKFLDNIAKKEGIRIISPNRPGMEHSTFYSPRQLIDWAQDVSKLAEFLQLNQFSILGISGGSPYALVCGKFIDHTHLKSIITISGVAPLQSNLQGIDRLFKIGIILGRSFPLFLSFGLWITLTRRYNNWQKALKSTLKDISSFPEKDQRIFQIRENVEIYARLMYEAFMNGTKPVKEDAMIYLRNWGFNLSSISSDIPIEIWHGEKDQILPLFMAENLAENIPHSLLRTFPNDGHLSTVFNHSDLLVKRIKFYFHK
ncbi:MAG: alpha/beta hydrolase [Candidatus Lokiarchaeota archaeon]|nr:alpha/beta hydrolase [Candidatus Harpocratesius repetitus]